MSSRIPARRLVQSAVAAIHLRSTRWVPCTSLPVTAQRNKSNPTKSATAKLSKSTPIKSEEPVEPVEFEAESKDLSNPLLEEYLKKSSTGAKDKKPQRPSLRTGTMSKTNPLFDPQRQIPGWDPSLPPEKEKALRAQLKAQERAAEAENEKKLSELNIDPDIRARRRLERKLVIKGVKRHGRLTKAQNIARTERQSLFKSQNLPTSTKKLQKVVNQIAGKTVSEALVQLRFSPKRIARDVIKGLEIAQNEAIAGRGMGLGGGKLAQKRWEAQRTQSELPGSDQSTALATQTLSASKEKPPRPATIEMKDGSRKLVRDPSEIYIDQAWVGKGETWKSPEYRARGMVNMLRHRTTSFSVLLKEEKTRMRISDEIKKKRDNRKLWVALPDRPVTAQRQYCLW